MKITALAAVLLGGLLVSGCTYWEAGKAIVDVQGATVADETLQTAEFVYCRAQTIGAVMREFSEKPEQYAAYVKLCQPHWVAK